jgi:hypothetical protein
MNNFEFCTMQIAHEFFTWLLWRTETTSGKFQVGGGDIVVDIDKRIKFTNMKDMAVLSGSEPGKLEEAKTALKSGKLISEIGVYVSRDQKSFSGILKSPGILVSNLKLPMNVDGGGEEELYDRMALYEEFNFLLCELFKQFVSLRIDEGCFSWDNVKLEIKKWVENE